MRSGCKIVPGGYDCSKLNWDSNQSNEGIDGWLMSLFWGSAYIHSGTSMNQECAGMSEISYTMWMIESF